MQTNCLDAGFPVVITLMVLYVAELPVSVCFALHLHIFLWFWFESSKHMPPRSWHLQESLCHQPMAILHCNGSFSDGVVMAPGHAGLLCICVVFGFHELPGWRLRRCYLRPYLSRSCRSPLLLVLYSSPVMVPVLSSCLCILVWFFRWVILTCFFLAHQVSYTCQLIHAPLYTADTDFDSPNLLLCHTHTGYNNWGLVQDLNPSKNHTPKHKA